jgi:hypothetical protein
VTSQPPHTERRFLLADILAANQDQQFPFLSLFPCLLRVNSPLFLSFSLYLQYLSLFHSHISPSFSYSTFSPLPQFVSSSPVPFPLSPSSPLPSTLFCFLFFSSSSFCLSCISHTFPIPSSLPPYFPISFILSSSPLLALTQSLFFLIHFFLFLPLSSLNRKCSFAEEYRFTHGKMLGLCIANPYSS